MIKFFFEEILLISDIENWLWLYDFGTFRRTVNHQKIFKKSFEYVDSWPFLWNSTTELILISIHITYKHKLMIINKISAIIWFSDRSFWILFTIYSKLYIPSTLNIDLILWHTQLIVCAENAKSWFMSWVFPFTFQAYILPHTLNCMCVGLFKFYIWILEQF